MLIGRLLLLLSLAAAQAVTPAVNAKAIEAAKAAMVRDIDSALPRVPLAQWLAALAGSAEAKWEVNDCGEQTGDPEIDRGRDIPMCVQADLTLAKDHHLYLLFAVGTFNTGLRSEPPHFFYGTTVETGVPTRWLTKLSDVPAALSAEKRQTRNPLPNKRLPPTVADAVVSAGG